MIHLVYDDIAGSAEDICFYRGRATLPAMENGYR